jgi:hypothetical protein
MLFLAGCTIDTPESSFQKRQGWVGPGVEHFEISLAVEAVLADQVASGAVAASKKLIAAGSTHWVPRQPHHSAATLQADTSGERPRAGTLCF